VGDQQEDHHMKKTMQVVGLMGLLATSGQSQVAITVYNNNLAVVRDIRAIDLAAGEQLYRFAGVAAQIDPTSVHFKSLTAPSSVQLIEQNYEFDLVGTERLLERYINQTVVVATEKGDILTGTLLNSGGGDVILSTRDQKVLTVKATTITSIEFPKLPDGLVTQPTLVWLLQNKKAGSHNCEISYLTRGVSWHAEYVAVTNANDTEMDLSAWVSIDNRSGASYENAKLKLVAGDVNIAQPAVPQPRMMKNSMAAQADFGFEEKAFFEYHLYTLPRRTTLNDRQIKQLALFPKAQAKIEKKFVYDGQRSPKDVSVVLEFKNSQDAGLGMPLPKGKVRVYKTDSDGSQEFIGEDMIDHTPKDEKVDLHIGNAFDLVGERTVKRMEKLDQRVRRETIEIKLRNHKEEDVVVNVVERFWGDWEFIGKTPRIVKQDANMVEFAVPVAKGDEAVFEYTVLIKS